MLASASSPTSEFPSQKVVNFRQALKLAISLVLFYWFALVMNWDVANCGSLSIVLVSLGTRGATLEKAIARVLGTTFGVAIGFLFLGLFHHDRWIMMLAFACYLAVVGFFMQGSRYSYAWFVTAFVPLVVWGDNYPHFENAFYFGTFRWLETTSGILIYTMVDLLLWPRHAGDQFDGQGRQLWADMAEWFTSCKTNLQSGGASQETTKLREKTDAARALAMTTLQQALLDTPGMRDEKKQWKTWERCTTEMYAALGAWSESIGDCLAFNLDRMVPGFTLALEQIEKRIEMFVVRWDHCVGTRPSIDANDAELIKPIALVIDVQAAKELSPIQRTALSNALDQMKIVDHTSRKLLSSLNELVGMQVEQSSEDSAIENGLLQLPRSIRPQVLRSLFPAVTFVIAFLFWIVVDPPTGAKFPMFAGIISLVILRTPMNPLPLVVVLTLSIFLAVAPVYWLVMPGIESGEGLLFLVFVYALIFGYLGGSRPVLKMGPLAMFVNMVGISNQQQYSFQGPVDGAIMLVLGGGCVALVYLLFSILRPDQSLAS